MGLFEDPVHDDFGSWTLGFAPYGGGDYGAVRQLASQVTPGDDASFAAAFRALAERRIQEAETLARSRAERNCCASTMPTVRATIARYSTGRWRTDGSSTGWTRRCRCPAEPRV